MRYLILFSTYQKSENMCIATNFPIKVYMTNFFVFMQIYVVGYESTPKSPNIHPENLHPIYTLTG